MTGTLYVVATPIGNLSDLSPRGQNVLSQVQLIAGEDTRRVRKLMSLLNLAGPPGQRLVACHEHNEGEVAPMLLAALGDGQDVALVSDAGTPLVSDPGHRLLRAAWDAGVVTVPVPGASAVLALLSVCPLSVIPWTFAGFLSSRAGRRRQELEALLVQPQAQVLFESPHRILDCLGAIAAIAPERRLFVGRELTKAYENFYLGTATEVAQTLTATDAVRGEFVLVLEASSQVLADDGLDAVQLQTFTLLVEELGPSRASKLMARLSRQTRGTLYDLALTLQRRDEP
jgi:16S rRNA (cytidine1402-2'-O)-methyltransferase